MIKMCTCVCVRIVRGCKFVCYGRSADRVSTTTFELEYTQDKIKTRTPIGFNDAVRIVSFAPTSAGKIAYISFLCGSCVRRCSTAEFGFNSRPIRFHIVQA